MAIEKTTRERAEALINEALHPTIIEDVTRGSTALSLMTRLPNMTSSQYRIPVADSLPLAYWVNGDTGMKGVSHAAWDNVYITAEEIAVIIPIAEAVLADASYDVMSMIKPKIVEAAHARIDDAILFGVNRPTSWQGDIVSLARNAGNVVTGVPTYANLMGVDGLVSKIEQSGKMPTGYIADLRVRGDLREITDTTERPIFRSGMTESTTYTLDGAPITFPQNGSFDSTRATVIGGAWGEAVYSIRQDVTFKILDQAVIQDPTTKEIVYNLAQQDMIALRMVMRLGWALPNPATRLDPTRSNVPFAILVPADATQVGTFSVTVNDGLVPVEGATVVINGIRKKTSALGVAEFGLMAGNYTGNVTANGFYKQTFSVGATGGTEGITLAMVSSAQLEPTV